MDSLYSTNSLDVYTSLALLQKGLRSYDNMIFDLKDQAISNRKKIGKWYV